MLKVGELAPDFSLIDAQGKTYSLKDFNGKKVVLYFYSKDMTGGCTTQALGYKELFEEFKKKNAAIVGISKDTAASHKKFAEKYQLPFLLLSDESLSAIKLFDVWGEKKLYGKTSFGVVRTTYIIDEKGIIIDARTKVKAAEDAQKTLEILSKL